MKRITKYLAVMLVSISFTTIATAQVTKVKVGDNPTMINPDAVLEIQSTNKGLLLPRLALKSTDSYEPLSAHVEGMTVFNTVAAGTDETAVTPGYYYNDGTQWVRVASTANIPTIPTEPWFRQGTPNTQATLNTENIYQTGKVSIGGSNGTGTLTVINASGANNTVDLAMRAALPSGGTATLNFISNLGTGSFSTLSRAGDKGLVFSTDGDPAAYSQNGLLIAPHTAAGGGSPFGFKITEQGLSTINAQIPTETFDVNGTFRVRQLPLNGEENAIFTLPNGNSSLPATGEIGDIAKTQTFTATRTVVANSRGVLGYVEGLPGGNITADNGLVRNQEVIELGGTLNRETTLATENDGTTHPLNITGLPIGEATDQVLLSSTGGQLKTITTANLVREPWYVIGSFPAKQATSNTDRIYQMGNVAVGASTIPSITVGATTVNPKFHVAGDVSITGKYYTTNSVYADYVFEKYFKGNSDINPTYEFKSLNYVKDFIKANHHLPGVESIADLAKAENGYTFDLTKLTVQSLEKIEELYIHTIEQQDLIDKQAKEIDELKARMDRLEKLLLNK